MEQESNDIDELVRKAAEDYPLKTDTSDWEEVRKKLYGKDESERAIPVFFIYALLIAGLFTAGWFGYKYFSPKSPDQTAKVDAGDQPFQQKINSAISSPSQVKVPTTENASNSTTYPQQKQLITTSLKSTAGTTNKNISGSRSQAKTQHQQHDLVNSAKDQITTTNQQSTTNNNNVASSKDNSTVINKEEILKQDNVVKKPGQNIEESKPPAVKEQANNVQGNNPMTTSPTTVKKDHKKENYLYAGLIIAPDVSTVKFQSVKNVGLNAGALFGYQLNKHFAVETGVMMDRKFYYSDGKYFNTAKVTLPPYGKITKVDGNCRMVEVPVNVKYNFKAGKKSQVFATAGMSSYFMKKENYDYTIVSTGASYDRYSAYKSSSDYWLSVINVSVGYNRPVGKASDLRIEPYIKIPVKGLGLGSLPITSFGINIGVTKKLF